MNAPPLLVSYSDLEQYIAALPVGLPTDQIDDLSRLAKMGFPPVASVRALAILFGVSAFFLGAIRKKPERYYRTFKIKKGKGVREIHAPRVALKVFQKWLAEHLSKKLVFPDSVFGFVPGRSAVDASAVHCGAKWIYSVDIESFFPSVRRTQVISSLQDLGYSSHASELIADLCCYQGALSQGSPASPVLSNLVFKVTDDALQELAQEKNLRLSRYADDVVFSGTEAFPSDLPGIVRRLIEARGWQLAEAKEYFSQLPLRLKVHGLLVHGVSPRLTKGYRNRLRAYKHLLDMGRVVEEDLQRVNGHLAFGRAVDRWCTKRPQDGE